MSLDFSKYTLDLATSPNAVRIIVKDAVNNDPRNDTPIIKLGGSGERTRHAGDILVSRTGIARTQAMLDRTTRSGYRTDEPYFKDRLLAMGFIVGPNQQQLAYTDSYLWSPIPRHINLANSILGPNLRRNRFKLELDDRLGTAMLLLAGIPILGINEYGFTPYAGYYSSEEGLYIMSKHWKLKDSFGDAISYETV